MLKFLRIRNFKGWEDTGQIKLAPLSLFFGANSSGKSSIGQFLMLLKQTAEFPDRKAVFYPGGRNSAVQLGSFKEMLYHRNNKNKLAFEYHWSLPDVLKFTDPISNVSFSGDWCAFSAESGLDANEQTVIDKCKYNLYSTLRDSLDDAALIMAIGMNRISDAKAEYEVEAKNYKLKRNKGRVWNPGAPVRFYGFPDEVVAYYQNADFVQLLNLNNEMLFRSLHYLGPLRTKAERIYSWAGIEPESVGYAGENTVAAILAAKSRRISLGRKKQAKSFEAVIAEKLVEMGLIEEFKINPISKQRQEYEVKIRTKGSMDLVDIPDVGFGVSQVLPVLVQCFYAPPGSIIIMEQPEIHLHPSAQSALADVMIDAISAREKGTDRNIQLLIETHSEHFLRRLQRRIAEDKSNQLKDKVSIYFADISKTPASLEPLRLDLFGNIGNWPKDFFGDEMGDVTAHAKAAMERRKTLLRGEGAK